MALVMTDSHWHLPRCMARQLQLSCRCEWEVGMGLCAKEDVGKTPPSSASEGSPSLCLRLS